MPSRNLAIPCGIMLGLSTFASLPAAAQQGDSAVEAQAIPATDPVLDAEIQQHIQNLGHPSYAVRMRARYELQRLGLMAMDAIRAAEESPDTEIAFAARFLMSSLNIQWAQESDPAEVRQILTGYDELNNDERKSRMDRLANLPDRLGTVALSRLARFEQSLKLSRWAALLAMQAEPDQAPLSEVAIGKIRDNLGDSLRVSVRWLRQFLDDLNTDSYDAQAWRELIRDERTLIENSTDRDQTVPPILVELYRVSAGRALQSGDRGEALALATDGLDTIMSRRQDLLDAVNWALDTGLHEVVLELRDREPQRFANEAELMYGVAEAHRIQGNDQQAEQSRLEALEIGAIPEPDSEAAEEMRADQIERLAMRHRELASILRTRGLFDWAEGEYRHAIDRLPIDSLPAAMNRSDLSEMLDFQQRHGEIVPLLEPLVERLEKDRIFRGRFQQRNWQSADALASLLEYHRGLASEGDAARTALRKALHKSRNNSDILIAMYRQPGDDEWREEVRQEIERAADAFVHDIVRDEEGLKGDPNNERVQLRLATTCNQYAWLVSNTYGDKTNALRLSQRSLELVPETSAFLDTLARCHYALGELDRAIFHQRQAVRLEPHVPPLRRQLEFFLEERASEASKASEEESEESATDAPAAASDEGSETEGNAGSE